MALKTTKSRSRLSDVNLNYIKAPSATRLAVVLMLFSMFLLAMAIPVSAAGISSNLIVLTDEKIYEVWKTTPSKTSFSFGKAIAGHVIYSALDITVYAVILDDSDNIMTGIDGATINGVIDDIEKYICNFKIDHSADVDEYTIAIGSDSIQQPDRVDTTQKPVGLIQKKRIFE